MTPQDRMYWVEYGHYWNDIDPESVPTRWNRIVASDLIVNERGLPRNNRSVREVEGR